MTVSVASKAILRATGLGVRVAVAESLTGGLLAATLIEVPGASLVVSGGVVAYDSALKSTLLGVNAELLARTGPVDAEVARQMAAGVRRACAVPGTGEDAVPADIGLSTTGVAGPDPDPQTGAPVGTVWIGVSSALGERAVALRLTGSRADIRAATVVAAVELLDEELEGLGALP